MLVLYCNLEDHTSVTEVLSGEGDDFCFIANSGKQQQFKTHSNPIQQFRIVSGRPQMQSNPDASPALPTFEFGQDIRFLQKVPSNF